MQQTWPLAINPLQHSTLQVLMNPTWL